LLRFVWKQGKYG